MTVEEILSNSTVDGMVVRLPEGQLDRKLYEQVAKRLQGIGGKWVGRKVMGFVFTHDPTELLAEVSGGAKINLKKEFQFFRTPDELADRMANLLWVKDEHYVLEPSAGDGSLIDAVFRTGHRPEIKCFEAMPQNVEKLKNDGRVWVDFIHTDFMDNDVVVPNVYDRIIANPPFTNNQDIDHVMQMYRALRHGGRMVTLMSKHWTFAEDKKSKDFREFIKKLKDNAEVEDIESGAFKESGTMVPTVLVIINKPFNGSLQKVDARPLGYYKYGDKLINTFNRKRCTFIDPETSSSGFNIEWERRTREFFEPDGNSHFIPDDGQIPYYCDFDRGDIILDTETGKEYTVDAPTYWGLVMLIDNETGETVPMWWTPQVADRMGLAEYEQPFLF